MNKALVDHRSNNFDALRLIAATFVIFSHSWPLSGHFAEPIFGLTNGTIGGGTLGVWMFFFMSGALVTESFQRRGLLAFMEARFLRIMPGLSIALLYGIAIGAAVTALPLRDFLHDPATRNYLVHGLELQFEMYLPAVFSNNHFPKAVNGSLWTLPVETAMYFFLAGLGALTFVRRRLLGTALVAGLLLYLSVDASFLQQVPLIHNEVMAPPVRSFLLGILFCLNRDRIPLHGAVALVLIVLIIPGMAKPEGPLLVCLAIAYTTAWLAYHPNIRLPMPAAIGDISYGLYIYAFPTQQMFAFLFPNIPAWVMFFCSWMITAVIAWLSWRFVEQPAMRQKGKISGWLMARLSRFRPYSQDAAGVSARGATEKSRNMDTSARRG